MSSVKVIAFDADDTLWDNEAFFQETESRFCDLLENYLPRHTVARELLSTEVQNIQLYGYGIKAFMLSMIEAAIRITNGTINGNEIATIIGYGKEMLEKPVTVLDGVEQVLSTLRDKYRLVMATKGDLLDQERKLKKSGLQSYFHHIEIMSEKKEEDYLKLIRRLDIEPHEFVMIGNSVKSDVLPVLAVGGHGIHVPYHTTWALERVDGKVDHVNFRQLDKLIQILEHY